MDGQPACTNKGEAVDYYDNILMDIQMPFMNEYEAAEQIMKMYPDI